jgi:hypothetical protein
LPIHQVAQRGARENAIVFCQRDFTRVLSSYPLRQPGAQQKGEKLIATVERTVKRFRLEQVGNLLLRGFKLLPVMNPTCRASRNVLRGRSSRSWRPRGDRPSSRTYP